MHFCSKKGFSPLNVKKKGNKDRENNSYLNLKASGNCRLAAAVTDPCGRRTKVTCWHIKRERSGRPNRALLCHSSHSPVASPRNTPSANFYTESRNRPQSSRWLADAQICCELTAAMCRWHSLRLLLHSSSFPPSDRFWKRAQCNSCHWLCGWRWLDLPRAGRSVRARCCSRILAAEILMRSAVCAVETQQWLTEGEAEWIDRVPDS